MSQSAAAPGPSAGGVEPVFALGVANEHDVFVLRRLGRDAAAAVGLDRQDQVRLATALSELGRDRLAGTGVTAVFGVLTGDQPPGRGALAATLAWTGGPPPGAEALASARRLLPELRYEPEASRLVLTCALPGGVPAPGAAERLRGALRGAAADPGDEHRTQTEDLIAALEETRRQREELRRLNAELEETNQGVLALYAELSGELEETNRGVVALYAELEDKSRQLREAGEARTRFWTNISHELRTPVNAVVGLSRLLLAESEQALTSDQRTQLDLIRNSGHTLLALVNELLDVAKVESGQLRPQPAPVDVRLVLAQLAGSLRGACAEGVELVVPEPSELPEAATDEVMLTRVLRNLLSNALKFTERGEVRLDVRAEVEAPAPGGMEEGDGGGTGTAWLTFTVRDTGIGIPADQLPLVFEEFYQVPGPHQRRRAGTGLGLPYARRLTELLGGSFTLTSEPGRGTTAEVRIPAALSGKEGIAEDLPRQRREAGREPAVPRASEDSTA